METPTSFLRRSNSTRVRGRSSPTPTNAHPNITQVRGKMGQARRTSPLRSLLKNQPNTKISSTTVAAISTTSPCKGSSRTTPGTCSTIKRWPTEGNTCRRMSRCITGLAAAGEMRKERQGRRIIRLSTKKRAGCRCSSITGSNSRTTRWRVS